MGLGWKKPVTLRGMRVRFTGLGRRTSFVPKVHQTWFPPTRTEFLLDFGVFVFLFLTHWLFLDMKGEIFQSCISTILLWKHSPWLTWNKLKNISEMVCNQSPTKWILKQCWSNIWIQHLLTTLLIGTHLFISCILFKPKNGYLALKTPEKHVWVFEGRCILPLNINNRNVSFLIVCDRLTSWITTCSNTLGSGKTQTLQEKGEEGRDKVSMGVEDKASVPSQF